jgi:hypothetical protein
MSEAYGLGQEISFGNHANDSVLAANRAIRVSNERARQERQNAITTARANVAGLNTRQGQVDDVIKTIGESAAAGNKGAAAVARGAGRVGQTAVRGAGQLASGVAAPFVKKIPVSRLDQLDNAGVSARGESSVANIAPRSKILGDVVSDGSETLGDLNKASKLNSAAQVISRGGEAAASLAPEVSGGATALEDTLKVGGQALSVGLGALDAVEDISAGKIVGNNTAERVSNVAGMASGALEGLGLALDATGVGAPVGVALNVLGGIAGLVSGGADIVGQEEEKKSAQQKVQQIQQTPAKQVATQAFRDVGSAGVEVKG